MIHGISGKTGGGKSYEAVARHIIPVITEQKRKVVTNLPLQIDHFVAVYGDYCKDLIEVVDGQFHNYAGERPFSKAEHYLQYEDWQNENGQRVYFFIDECHLALPQGSTEKEVKEFYSMHRHYGFDIMLITQNFRKVDRDIRDLVGNHYRAIKKSMMGQDDKYILKVHDGASNTNQSVVATHEREYEPKYFKFYQSHTKSDSSIKEASPNDIKKWYDNWFIKGAALMLLFGIFMVYTAFQKQAEKDQKLEQIKNKNHNPVHQKVPDQYANNQPVPIGQSQPLKPKEPEKPKKPKHPYYKVQLHIAGWMDILDQGKRTKLYHISASQNGQHMYTFNHIDLSLAGYSVSVKAQCLIEISYNDYSDFLTCDAPRVGLEPQNNVPNPDGMVAKNF
jgi:zona occludens toxin